jgi:hypothetical protein
MARPANARIDAMRLTPRLLEGRFHDVRRAEDIAWFMALEVADGTVRSVAIEFRGAALAWRSPTRQLAAPCRFELVAWYAREIAMTAFAALRQRRASLPAVE